MCVWHEVESRSYDDVDNESCAGCTHLHTTMTPFRSTATRRSSRRRWRASPSS